MQCQLKYLLKIFHPEVEQISVPDQEISVPDQEISATMLM